MELLKNMLDMVEDDTDNPIPVEEVDSQTLKRVIDFSEHHGDEIHKINIDRKFGYDNWEDEFFKQDFEQLKNLLRAADYLVMNVLVNKTAKIIAGKMKGKTTDEIAEMFGVENTFSPESQAEVRKEYAWCCEA